MAEAYADLIQEPLLAARRVVGQAFLEKKLSAAAFAPLAGLLAETIPAGDTARVLAFRQEIEKAKIALETGRSPEAPDLFSGERQLLWGLVLGTAFTVPEVAEKWDDEARGGSTYTTCGLWKQIAETPLIQGELYQCALLVGAALNRKDMKIGWAGPMGAYPDVGYYCDTQAGYINLDMVWGLLMGVEHARSAMMHEIGHGIGTIGLPPKFKEIRDQYLVLAGDYNKAVKEGLPVSQEEVDRLNDIKAKHDARMMMWDECENSYANRFLINRSAVSVQDFGDSLNRIEMVFGGFDIPKKPAEVPDSAWPDAQTKFANAKRAMRYSLYKNNNFFPNTAEGWRSVGVEPDWIEEFGASPKKGWAALQELARLCQTLEVTQAKPLDYRLGATRLQDVATRTAAQRNLLIDDIYDRFAAQIADDMQKQAKEEQQKKNEADKKNDPKNNPSEDQKDQNQGQGQGQGKGEGQGDGAGQGEQGEQDKKNDESAPNPDEQKAPDDQKPTQGQGAGQKPQKDSKPEDKKSGEKKPEKKPAQEGGKGEGKPDQKGDKGEDKPDPSKGQGGNQDDKKDDKTTPESGNGQGGGEDKPNPEGEDDPQKGQGKGDDKPKKGKGGIGPDRQQGPAPGAKSVEEVLAGGKPDDAAPPQNQPKDDKAEKGGVPKEYDPTQTGADLPTREGDYNAYREIIRPHTRTIARVRSLFEDITKQWSEWVRDISSKRSLVPEDGNLRRLDVGVVQDRLLKQATGQKIGRDDYEIFRVDGPLRPVPAQTDIFIVIDGSGSMKGEPSEMAITTACILYEAVKTMDYLKVHILMQGAGGSYSVAQPGMRDMDVGRGIERMREGIGGCNDHFAPALSEVLKSTIDARADRDLSVGHTMIFNISDGHYNDTGYSVPLVKKVAKSGASLTMDFILIDQPAERQPAIESTVKDMMRANPRLPLGCVKVAHSREIPAQIMALLEKRLRGVRATDSVPFSRKKREFQALLDQFNAYPRAVPLNGKNAIRPFSFSSRPTP